MSDTTSEGRSNVERLLESLRQSYLAELPERCDELEAHVMALSDSNSFSQAFEALYRDVHSIKGSGGTHGCHVLSTVCHHFEDLLTMIDQKIDRVADNVIDAALKYVDLLRDTTWQLQTGNLDQDALNHKLELLSDSVFPGEYNALLVDGSKFNVKVCADALKGLPVKLTVVQDGFRALERLLQENFDFVITSKELPVLNGVALLSALRASETNNAHVKAVLMTSKDSVDLPSGDLVNHIVKKDRQMAGRLKEVTRELLSAMQSEAKR